MSILLSINSEKYGLRAVFFDKEDHKLISKYKWSLAKQGRCFCAITWNGQITITMHILIMGRKKGYEIDHINHNSLDNRRCNLRWVTHAQNIYNSRPYIKKGTSLFKGVSYYKNYGKWRSQICFNDKRITLGYYEKEEDAARVYNAKAKELFGEYAYLNPV